MANFGLAHLCVAAPYAPHWREARSAVGAPELLQNAKETETLAEAVADCTLVVGTGTLTYRKPEQKVLSLPALGPVVGGELARGGPAWPWSLARKNMGSPAKTSPTVTCWLKSPPTLSSLDESGPGGGCVPL